MERMRQSPEQVDTLVHDAFRDSMDTKWRNRFYVRLIPNGRLRLFIDFGIPTVVTLVAVGWLACRVY
jgi:hypothetical protein